MTTPASAATPPPAEVQFPLSGIVQAAAAALGREWAADALYDDDVPSDGMVTFARLSEIAADVGLLLTRRDTPLATLGLEAFPVMVPLADGGAIVVQRIVGGIAQYRDSAQPFGVKTAAVAELSARGLGWVAPIAWRPEAAENADEPGPETGGLAPWLWRGVIGFWRYYLLVLLAVAASNVLALAVPLFSMALYDRVIPNAAFTTLGALTGGVAIALVLDFALRQLRTTIVEAVGRRMDERLARLGFERIVQVKLANRPAATGAAASDLAEVEGLRDLLTSSLPVALMDLAFSVVFVAVIFVVAGPLALIPLAGMILAILLALGLHVPAARAAKSMRRADAERQGQLVEVVAGLEAVKVWRAEAQMRRRFADAATRRAADSAHYRRLQQTSLNAVAVLSQAVTVLTLLAAVIALFDKQLTVGAIIAVSMLSSRAMAPAASLGSLLQRLAQGRHALRSLDTLLRQPTERTPGDVPAMGGPMAGSIAFRNVTFSFPGQPRPALQDVSFAIAPGERVAVVGRVGSGKSSLARLIAGLYDDFSGSVMVAGIDVRQIAPAILRRNIGYAMQDVSLFRGTLYENVTAGLPGIDRERVMEAARIAGLDEAAALHPLGFGMPVAEHGRNLSGGTRQAVMLTRAIAARPRLLILDEPTSAMDNVAEAQVVQRLRAALEPAQTLLVITHRSALLELADRMIVLDGGRLLADGARDSVVRRLRESIRAVPDPVRKPAE